MKTIILMALSGVLLSAAPPVSNSDTEEVLAAMDAYKNAMLHKDRAALAKLVSDDIMYVHSSGTKYETKADLLKFNSAYENIIFLSRYDGSHPWKDRISHRQSGLCAYRDEHLSHPRLARMGERSAGLADDRSPSYETAIESRVGESPQ